jgi:hypothetical protein
MARRRSKRRTKRTRTWNPVRHPGSLKRLGYDPDDKTELARHRALAKAIKRYGYKKTVQKLAFLKGAARVPSDVKRAVARDLEWLKKKYGKKRR